MIISKKSPLSGKTTEMELPVTTEQLQRWENGELIQNAMPELTPNQREFLITGIVGDEWDSLFPEGDE